MNATGRSCSTHPPSRLETSSSAASGARLLGAASASVSASSGHVVSEVIANLLFDVDVVRSLPRASLSGHVAVAASSDACCSPVALPLRVSHGTRAARC